MSKIKRAGKVMSCLLFCLILLCAFSANAAALAADEDSNQLKVPVVFDLSRAIAGAEFKFEYTDGLEFVAYEKSEAVQSAMTTPVVEKKGYTQLGFFAADNYYEPEDEKLDVGYLVFNHSGEPNQSVTINEVKMVWVVDNNRTESEVIVLIEELPLPLSGAPGMETVGGLSTLVKILLCVVFLLLCAVVYLLLTKKKTKKTQA